MNQIIPFQNAEHVKMAEREKTVEGLKYHISVSVLQWLYQNKEITRRELELGKESLARKFNRQSVR